MTNIGNKSKMALAYKKTVSEFTDKFADKFTVRNILALSKLGVMTVFMLLVTAESAFAQSMGDVIANAAYSMGSFPLLLAALAYLSGLSFTVWAIFEFRKVADNPAQNSVKKPILLLAAAGMMLSAPMVVEALYNAISFGLVGTTYTGSGLGSGTGGEGLDQILVRFMANISGPMITLIAAFAYIFGIYLILRGILKLAKASNEGWYSQGNNATSLFASFIIGAALLSLGQIMASMSGSLFGDSVVANHAVLAISSDGEGVFIQRANEALKAVIVFVQLVGWLSFLRGWFILKSVADGNGQASFQAGLTHIIGGAVAVNLVPLVGAIQTTLGMQAFTI